MSDKVDSRKVFNAISSGHCDVLRFLSSRDLIDFNDTFDASFSSNFEGKNPKEQSAIVALSGLTPMEYAAESNNLHAMNAIVESAGAALDSYLEVNPSIAGRVKGSSELSEKVKTGISNRISAIEVLNIHEDHQEHAPSTPRRSM